MATQWPLIITGLATSILPTLAGWAGVVDVYDGPLTTQTPRSDYCTVGEQVGMPAQGNGSSVQHPNGGQRIETGSIHSQLVSQTGDRDVPTMRARVFGFLDALDEYIRVNRTLDGLLSAQDTSDLSWDPVGLANPSGSAFVLNFTITYLTVT